VQRGFGHADVGGQLGQRERTLCARQRDQGTNSFIDGTGALHAVLSQLDTVPLFETAFHFECSNKAARLKVETSFWTYAHNSP
jgi:hypothetical protein